MTACLVAPAAMAQETAPAVEEMLVRVMAIAEATTVRLGEFAVQAAGEQASFYWDEALAVRVAREDGLGAAMLHVPDAGLTLVVTGLTLRLQLRAEDGGVDLTIDPSGQPGWVDVYHDREQPYLRMILAGGMAGVRRGALRLTQLAAEGGFEIAVARGEANVAGAAGTEARLSAAAQNMVFLSPAGALSPPGRRDALEAEMLRARGLIVQQSVLPEFVRVAEAVAEGDIEPPTRGSLVMAAAVAPAVQIREIVPRGGLVTRVAAGAVTGGRRAAVQSIAEQFIGAGEAALAVVGARFERTRVTAASGLRPPLAINRELRSRFTLGR